MTRVTREQVVDSLSAKWTATQDRIRALPPAEQRAFLERQGYGSHSDMQVHIFAWWQECARVIRAVQADPDAKPVEPNVDDFNARTIAAHAGIGEAERAAEMEQARLDLLGLVRELPDALLAHPVVDEWLYWCVTNHVVDHSVKE